MALVRRFLPGYWLAAAMFAVGACGGSTEDDTGARTDAAADAAGDAPGTDAPGADSGATDAVADAAEASDGTAACFGDTGEVPSVPFKVCDSDSDCVTATHTTDCCGNSVILGVNKSQQAALAACEKPWDEHFPGCGCPAGPPKTDDGKSVTDPTLVVVKCTDRTSTTGICKTSLP